MARCRETHNVQMLIQCSSLALLYYDYILTFHDEQQYIWRSRFSLSTWLYFGCRYALVANLVYLIVVLGSNGRSSSSCYQGYLASGILSIIGRGCVLGTLGLRTWAIYGRKNWVAVWFASLGLVWLVTDPIHVAGSGCHGKDRFPIASQILAIAVCCIEFSSTGMTLVRCHHVLKSGVMMRRKKSYTSFVVEQGILYTAMVSGFTISATVLNFCFSGVFLQRLLNALTLPISGVMTARFLLQLRKMDNETAVNGKPGEQEVSILVFHHSDHSPSFMTGFGDDPMLSVQHELETPETP